MKRRPAIEPRTAENMRLAENVRPEEWTNPEPADRYNLVVIGAGTAGLVCAAGAAGLGARVALVERNLMGGDCLNVGCVPSKGVIAASRAIRDVRSSGAFGISGAEGASIDFGIAMERMRKIRAAISLHDSARRFRDDLGVDLFFGEARFIRPDEVEVEGKRLKFARAAVCTGTRPATLPIPGLEEAGYLTNETVFSLTELPRRLAVIGGGPIGCELAQAFARMGSRVTILEAAPQLLGREDPDAAEILKSVFLREAIDLRLGVKIAEVRSRGGERSISVESGGRREEIAADEILVAAGRLPNVDGLGLAEAGVEYDGRTGVKVDDLLRTTNPFIYAAGDVCSPFRFTHTADAMARIVIANALFPGRQKVSGLVIPWCTYTDPEVAHVGMYEREAQEKGIETTTLTVPLAEVDRAFLEGETEGFARVHLKKGSDQILGATVVARHAGEMISEISVAMTARLGLSAIGRTIHPYPTRTEAIRKLADAYNRERLTPMVKSVLSAWLSWRRS
jgi:pyruvate/2-oxoglutarate dehydrogenase complex dihydrolipoamide dehydrogenase (E3) component